MREASDTERRCGGGADLGSRIGETALRDGGLGLGAVGRGLEGRRGTYGRHLG